MSIIKTNELGRAAGALATAFALAATQPAHAQDMAPSPELSLPLFSFEMQPEPLPSGNFILGECYMPQDFKEYLVASDQKPILRLDVEDVAYFNDQAFPVVNETYIMANEHGWSILMQGLEEYSGQICLSEVGKDMEYVSLRDKDFQMVDFDSNGAALSPRENEIAFLGQQYGETPFLSARNIDGARLDVLVSMDSSWSVLVTDPDGANSFVAVSGHNYEIVSPHFENVFGLFSIEDNAAPKLQEPETESNPALLPEL